MRVAVLIDADNIAASHAATVFSYASSLGTAVIKRAYGRQSAMNDWADAVRDRLCEMRLQGALGPAKNGTDIALAVDAMDILHAGVVDSFCIVSDDRDFVPLAVRLRAAGKHLSVVCKQAGGRYDRVFDDVLELMPDPPIVSAFRTIVDGRTPPEMSLADAGRLLRRYVEIPKGGKAPLRRMLENTKRFTVSGSGSDIRVSLRA